MPADYTHLSSPPVASTDELVAFLRTVTDELIAQRDGLAALAEWLETVQTHWQVHEMVAKASESAAEVVNHMSTAHGNAEHHYQQQMPDFSQAS